MNRGLPKRKGKEAKRDAGDRAGKVDLARSLTIARLAARNRHPGLERPSKVIRRPGLLETLSLDRPLPVDVAIKQHEKVLAFSAAPALS